jgi:hypothetical protein
MEDIKEIHIRMGTLGWQACIGGIKSLDLIHTDKNKVVKNAIHFIQKYWAKAKIVIHGLDGRILEEREIRSEPDQIK